MPWACRDSRRYLKPTDLGSNQLTSSCYLQRSRGDRISWRHIRCGQEQPLTLDENALVYGRRRLKTCRGDQKPLCVAHGAGIAVSSELSSREEGIRQEWCQVGKLWSLVGSGEGEERAGGFPCRSEYDGCFTDPCSDGSGGAVLLLCLFCFTLCWSRMTEDIVAVQVMSGPNVRLLPYVDPQHFLPMCVCVGYSLALCTSANLHASAMP